MKLTIARHLWGVELPLDVALPRFVAKGYGAIETGLPADPAAFKEQLRAHGLGYIPMIFTGGKTEADHLAAFRKDVAAAVATGAKQITVHSGSDVWSAASRLAFYREVSRIEKDLPVPVAHETHRGRAFFNPWGTRDVLLECPDIKLCCDFSHWVCVAERLNWDDENESILKLCAERTIHVHARVGYEEGPQVPDPSAPEYAHHVVQHIKWWKTIWSALRKRGEGVSTVTPEFGPPGYLHTLPHTNVPVANLETVCDWMADRVREEFAAHVV